jgi:hypothetical protein
VTHEYPPNRAFDSVSISRVSALREYGLTRRQREFLVTVMVHSGCLLERQYCDFTGTVRGQNSREFMARLVAREFARAIEPGPVRRGRLYHVHHRPLYGAIDPALAPAIAWHLAALGDGADRRHLHWQVDGRVLAAFAQFDNDVRSDRTRAGMQAALELGRWVFLGIAFDGNRFVGTGATAPAFSYLREIRTENEGLVAQIFTSWNPLMGWIRKIETYRVAA